MNESEMQHGIEWWGHDVSGWLASEKFDGCRAYWNGAQLWTRGGRVVNTPQWFTAALPAGVHLDGEIWAGREQLQAARLAVRYGAKFFTTAITFKVFDAPRAAGTWAERMRACEAFRYELVAPVEFQIVESAPHLFAMFNAIKTAGGEGLIVRRPDSRYAPGRTDEILKVTRSDQFAATFREAA